MNRKVPAVSIIIPMYNTEKYIGECLDSILAQTFQDFEVIVVDDCSTDDSRAVVESYLPKFNRGVCEKLFLLRTNKNSGGGYFPRNIGMRISRGEYLMFIDSDDAITSTALEELYNVAENFKADVVHCERYYKIPSDQKLKDINAVDLKPTTDFANRQFVTEPVLLSENKEMRIRDFEKRQIIWNFCGKLIRRGLISENELEMVGKGAEDMILTACLLCCADKYVRVPNPVYFYRMTENSVVRKKYSVEESLRKWIQMLSDGINYLEKFLDRKKIFSDNIRAKYILYEAVTSEFMNYLLQIYAQIPAWQLDALIRLELDKLKNKTAVTAFLFSRMNFFNVQLNRQGVLIQQMNAHIQKQNEVIRQLQAQLKK